MSSVLQGFPRTFQEDALLRINQLCFASTDVKESGIEEINILQERAAFDVVRRSKDLLADSSSAQFIIRKFPDRLHSSLKVLPEFFSAAGAWEPANHSYNRQFLFSASRRCCVNCPPPM